jgi:hypothetical protein
LPTVPCIIASHLNDQEQRVVRLTLNRLGERGGWSLPELRAELIELINADIAIEDAGFTIAEFDQITLDDEVEPLEKGTLAPNAEARAIQSPQTCHANKPVNLIGVLLVNEALHGEMGEYSQ